MSHETYHQIARYGIFILILVLQIPVVQQTLDTWTTTSWLAIAGWFGMPADHERPAGLNPFPGLALGISGSL